MPASKHAGAESGHEKGWRRVAEKGEGREGGTGTGMNAPDVFRKVERHHLDTHAAVGGRDMADVSTGCLRTTAG